MADFVAPNTTPLRIALRTYAPYNNACAMKKWPLDPKACKHPGLDIELMLYLLNFLNVNYTMLPVSDEDFKAWNGWGQVNDNHTKVSGILGKVEDGYFDTAGIWFGMTTPRMKHTAYSYPIQYTRPIGFIMQEPRDSMGMDASALLYRVFQPLIWIAVGSLSVGVLLLIFLAPNVKQWMNGRYYKSIRDYDYEGLCRTVYTALHQYHGKGLWGTLCIALHQYHGNVSTGTKFGNIAMISAGFLFLFTSTLYEGVLVGALMSKSDKMPFTTLSGLAELVMAGEYRLASDGGVGNAFFWDTVAKPEAHGHIKLNQSIEAMGIYTTTDLDKLVDEIARDPMLVWPGQDIMKMTG